MELTEQHRLRTTDAVEAIIGRPPAVIMQKQIDVLDKGCVMVLARCPIAAFGYRDAEGTSRTTFVGGTPGFVRVDSPTRFSFDLPERGEPYGPVSFFFLLPGVGEVLRVNGTVAAHKRARTTIEVAEAYVHCAQAVLRAGLWQPPPALEQPAVIEDDGPLRAEGVAEFLGASPFLAVSTWDAGGGSDTSPRGDQGTVARILDGRTLAIPDRKGNKRADTLHNLLDDERIALAALVPGRNGVLHIRGRGLITDDPGLLATMALRGQPPHAALLIDVEHVELSGNHAVTRSRMWNPDAHVRQAPDLMAIASEHLAAGSSQGFLLRAVGTIPGITRLLRFVMNRAYRSGLRKEGYGEVAVEARRGGGTENPLRDVRVAEVRRETPSAVTLVLEDGGSFDFLPGQFFTLVADIDGLPVRRAYSAASAPGPRLEVTVKRVEGGRFSTHVHDNVRAGDRLAVRGPSGTFHTGSQPPTELVLIAAGSGVTPMMSMIRAGLAGRVSLLYSSRNLEEVIYGEELNRLPADVTHVLTGRDGRLDADRVRGWIVGLSAGPDAHYYVCGPTALMDTVQEVLTGLGIPGERVHSERFTSGGELAATTTVPQPLTVEENGRPVGTAVVEPGQTLLDAGLAAGLPMPYSCTVGSCGDCKVRLRAGSVTQPRDDGYVLACQSCPLSPVTLDIAVAVAEPAGAPGRRPD
ncbi:2Fe-2S iron-sulfur cluster-binding protein [Paractinoplanes lichenicola]|uniref:2Fe-2S iron-sulfur cluster binding domain-containing protein n=1 Tax=Paractinoplanes lichenicola TaxID=2802976 RepID=A0ABS1W2Y7_9ACTN|nr:2Fe-2S iron-sulfur cluster-binding protein [Actinoplanes lichenicola]MBL7261090.1 2Fe-2S iron-sulfur cluster binding domain-containing protein [Actinoplanes lichenicola]